ncbi:MAG: FeoB-associated Cys-rich membrane protein [Ruminococcus flavefaciens]|nr:FeoB-associated Cys-rich membrane protein [Ruminococcus flavefaciens]
MNVGTIITGLILFTVLALIVLKMIKDKKNGKSSCGCGCEHCPNSSACHGGKK